MFLWPKSQTLLNNLHKIIYIICNLSRNLSTWATSQTFLTKTMNSQMCDFLKINKATTI